MFFPEPFDFHYPDEGTYRNISSSIQLKMSIGEHESGTFVYVPHEEGEIEVFANDLVGPGGTTLPKDLINVDVVSYMNRDRSLQYLQNIWLRGGVNRDVKARSPILPMAIVPDEQEFLSKTTEAVGPIRLREIDHARAQSRPGQGKQFWVTVHIPTIFNPPRLRSLYTGNLTLVAGNAGRWRVPIEVEVLNVRLDDLWSQHKHIGVFQAVDQFDAVFRDAVTHDLTSHGVNGVFHRGATVADYEYFKAHGINFVINGDNLYLTAKKIRQIRDAGFYPFFYGFDEPNRTGKYDEHIAISRDIRNRGGLIGTSGSLDALQRIAAVAPQDWWNLSFATSWSPTDKVFAHLDDIRADPRRKIATLESVYPMTLLELYPLNTRLLYGFWLFNSNLDGGFAWAYSNDTRQVNPYTTTDWNGVAFPAEFYDAAGTLKRRKMLSSYAWEAFRNGAYDFRYAMTAKRLAAERGTSAQRDQFREAMRSYQRIFGEANSTRIDVVNSNGKVRETRHELFDLISELVSQP
ncbi:MAG: hypothetical protein ACRDRW_21945 [Pseudonocardiaceae bacterium]